MAKQKASTKTSSIKKKTFRTRIIAAPQCFQASFTSFIPFIPILNLINNDDSIFLENNVTVDKNSSSSSQYTVFYTVYLNKKTIEKNSKVY